MSDDSREFFKGARYTITDITDFENIFLKIQDLSPKGAFYKTSTEKAADFHNLLKHFRIPKDDKSERIVHNLVKLNLSPVYGRLFFKAIYLYLDDHDGSGRVNRDIWVYQIPVLVQRVFEWIEDGQL